MKAGEIGALVGGEVLGDEDRVVQGVGPLDSAGPGVLSFVASARYLSYLQATRAGVVLIRREWVAEVPPGVVSVVVEDPHQALYAVLTALYPPVPASGAVHPTAVVGGSAQLASGVTVGPYAVIGEGVELGAGVVIGSHVVVGDGCRLAECVTIHPHVTLYEGVVVGARAIIHSGARIGKQGFGFVYREGGHRKIPQVGGCVIGEDVEVGANVTIDRGSVGDTVIGAGTKIDNLVHLGHNARIGRQVLLISQVGISGSSSIGDGAVLGGQVGVAGHLSIGARARIGAQAGVISDVPAGETYSGYPARPHREALRAQAGAFKLPDIIRRLKKLEDALFRSGR